MRASLRQNGPLMPALAGGLVALLAAAFLALILPPGAGQPAHSSHAGSPGSSVIGTRAAAPQQSLHTIATPAVGTSLRLAAPGDYPPFPVQPIVAPRPTEPPRTPAEVAAVGSRPPLRILLCIWLN